MSEKATNRADKDFVFPREDLCDFVAAYFDKGPLFLDAVKQNPSPLYVLEPEVLRQKANRFRACFEKNLPRTSFYYAMKSNNLPAISGILLEQGFGLDVSSGVELQIALDLGARDIIFSGPGKTDAELLLAIDNQEKVILLVDSFGELERLKKLLEGKQKTLRIGVRLNNNPSGLWRKFGILPEELTAFFGAVSHIPNLLFTGLQFHSSWNLTPARQIDFIIELGGLLRTLPAALLAKIAFIDIGGGFWPSQGEWLLEDPTEKEVAGHDPKNAGGERDALLHYRIPALPIEVFAREIGAGIKEHILSLIDCKICFEPGRWICHESMHILIQVIDKKASDLVITDAGTNAVGWERFEVDYFPVLNLSAPDLTEKPCHILGALCTPHDVWGYAYFGKSISPGDVLLIPTQGAYTYSLRQNFIKALPQVVLI
ncbi:MAG: decarboxylase [Proteobacteria bacterium]|nr:decarboxylase [Pseudomonadota bacterium]MBU4133607.1 decarboxylase [Pseudomonadota bacterium]